MSQATLPDPMVPTAYRVRRARRELADVATLELTPVTGEAPSFLPGQFNMLYAFGVMRGSHIIRSEDAGNQ